MASFSTISGVGQTTGRGEIKRANALSPVTANILPVLVKHTATLSSLVLSTSGGCVTGVGLNVGASARSVANRIVSRDSIGMARTSVSDALLEFINGVDRVPPVCDTLGGSNMELCSLTQRKGAARVRPHRVRVFKLSILSPLSDSGYFAIFYRISGNACVESLTHSVKSGLNYNTALYRLQHIVATNFSVGTTIPLGRVAGRGVRDRVLGRRATISRLETLSIAGGRTIHFDGNNRLSFRHLGVTSFGSGRLFEVGCGGRFLNVNVTSYGGGRVTVGYVVGCPRI